MNDIHSIEEPVAPLAYQTRRLQNLVREVIQCCQDRMLYESERFGLPQAELRCLMLFEGVPYLTVKTISERMEIAKSRVTKLIGGLTNKDLVQASHDPRDGRVKLISLTPRGEQRYKDIRAFIRDAHERVLSQMAPAERNNILSALELLRSCMEVVKSELK